MTRTASPFLDKAQGLAWMDEILTEGEKAALRAARDAKSDADGAQVLADALGVTESVHGSMPALTDSLGSDFYEPVYLTEEEIEEKLEDIRAWAERVWQDEAIMAAQKVMCKEAGVLLPARCTHTFYGLRSPEKHVTGSIAMS
ncbi:hypothetical protein B0H11DRAFT_2220372 [Mycena galericulata]|nr:hypothetical protein B0H11DRAFT_2220372 [Mycena galericulata]